MDKELAVFTNTYPYGNGENFLENEAEFTFAKFSKVHIFPLYIPKGEDFAKPRKTPPNAVVHPPLLNTHHKDRLGLVSGGIFNFAPITFALKEFFSRGVYRSRKKLWIWSNYLCILRSILGNTHKMETVCNVLEKCKVAYFYWGDKSALIIPFLKKRLKDSAPNFVVRFHGSDIYEYAKGYLPFREMLYSSIDYAVPVSMHGKEYILKNYSSIPKEIVVHKLGSHYHSDACPNLGAPVPENNSGADCTGAFNIISCSNVIELKRVHLLASAMLILEQDHTLASQLVEKGISHICWTHIGDGPLLAAIKEFIMQNGVPQDHDSAGCVPIAFNFKGAMPHNMVMEYYQTHFTDLFVQVSRSEGVPVAIMEALSFGTPVIATDVGGVGELIPQGCKWGKLIPANTDAQSLANEIKGWILHSIEMPEFDLALAARKEWEEKWDSTKNFSIFAQFLDSI